MRRNKFLLIALLLTTVAQVWADGSDDRDDENSNDRDYRQSREPRGRKSVGQNCLDKLDDGRLALRVLSETPPVPPATKESLMQPKYLEIKRLTDCRSLELAAQVNRSRLNSDTDMIVSQDRKIACVKKGGYTLDWNSCKSALGAYNMIVVADAALDLTQQMRTAQNGEKLNKQVAEQIQQGNGQNAAYEASIQHNRNLAKMNEEKVAAYTLATGLLSTKIFASWQGKSLSALEELCKAAGKPGPVPEQPLASLSPAQIEQLPNLSCPQALESIKSELFSNEAAKGQLTAALMEYAAKAVAAGFASKNLKNIAKKVEQAKNGTEDGGPATFELCTVNPRDPRCQQAGPRTPGAEYVGGEFNVGDGIANNVFGPQLEDPANIGLDDPLNNAPGDTVADAGSPFEDAAKEADKIMDPAAAANVQASGGAQGGGGGGGGGLGGGGVSLGNDLKGPEAEQGDANVKAEKSSGNYAFKGGGGFQAVKRGKEDANPFASLFDAKSAGGGITEDRSIASDDIGGKDSGLFLRISKRYGKISGEKRIQAMNLE